jgi:hypothetical protein
VKALQSALIRPVWETDRGMKRGPWVLGRREMTGPRPLCWYPIWALGSKTTFRVSDSMRQMRLGVPQQMVDRTLLRSAIRTRCQSGHLTMGRSIPG